MRVITGRSSPSEACRGLSPKVEKSRLNQTTSGLQWRSSFSTLKMLVKLLNSQVRTTSYSASSAPSSLGSSLSASTVRLSRGSDCSSRAMWYPYSLSPRRLGGNALTKQIFMGPYPVLKERQSDHWSE